MLNEIKGQLEKEETSFGCSYKMVLELNLRVLISSPQTCGSDIPQYVLTLGNTLTHIVMKVNINTLVLTVQSENECRLLTIKI